MLHARASGVALIVWTLQTSVPQQAQNNMFPPTQSQFTFSPYQPPPNQQHPYQLNQFLHTLQALRIIVVSYVAEN